MILSKVILFVVISLILVIIAILKLKFRFWSMQPVFHVYDISYYLFYSGIILKDLPEKSRYTNFKDVETLTFGKNIMQLDKKRFVQLLNRHYLRNGNNEFYPNEKNVLPYFEGHNSPCFLSFYKIHESLHEDRSGEIVKIDRPVGVITSRPMNVTLRRLKKGTIRFEATYVDYLCVDKVHRKKGISEQLIATHNYNQCILKKKSEIAIFKKEGVLTGIVPICIFGIHIFSMRKWNKPADLLPPYSVVECCTSNMHHMYDFLRNDVVKAKFDLQIEPEVANLISLMKSKNIFIYLLLEQAVGVVGCYFFRKSCTTIEKNKEIVICFASINTSNKTFFINGFKQSLSHLCLKKESESKFHYVAIEEICDNDIIVANLKLKTWPEVTLPAAYFFYNYAFPTISAKKVLVLN